MKKEIQRLLSFCEEKRTETLWPGGPTGTDYLKGIVRKNRGSYVQGLDTLEKTTDFLFSLNFKKVEVSPEIQYGSCAYHQAKLPEGHEAFVGILTVKECREKGLSIKVRKGEHGDELVCSLPNKDLISTNIISVVVEDGMMSTWYPGQFTARCLKKISTDESSWSPNWAVKIE